jgi:hypothetical protein
MPNRAACANPWDRTAAFDSGNSEAEAAWLARNVSRSPRGGAQAFGETYHHHGDAHWVCYHTGGHPRCFEKGRSNGTLFCRSRDQQAAQDTEHDANHFCLRTQMVIDTDTCDAG